MKHIAPFRLKVHGFGRSVRSLLYLCIAYPMLHLLAAILTIPLLISRTIRSNHTDELIGSCFFYRYFMIYLMYFPAYSFAV